MSPQQDGVSGTRRSLIVGHRAPIVMSVMTNVYAVYNVSRVPSTGEPLQQPHEVGAIIIPTLQIQKPRLREAELHAQSHTAVSGTAAQPS